MAFQRQEYTFGLFSHLIPNYMKLGTFSFPITSFGLSNVRMGGSIVVDIFKEDIGFSIIPLLTQAERQLLKIPAALFFRMENGEPVSASAHKAGMFEFLRVIIQKLKDQKVLY